MSHSGPKVAILGPTFFFFPGGKIINRIWRIGSVKTCKQEFIALIRKTTDSIIIPAKACC